MLSQNGEVAWLTFCPVQSHGFPEKFPVDCPGLANSWLIGPIAFGLAWILSGSWEVQKTSQLPGLFLIGTHHQTPWIMHCIYCLLHGWMAVFSVPLHAFPPWSASRFYIFNWILCLGKRKESLCCVSFFISCTANPFFIQSPHAFLAYC